MLAEEALYGSDGHLNRAINEGYRAGEPVIVFSNRARCCFVAKSWKPGCDPGPASPPRLSEESRLRNGLRATGLRPWRRQNRSTTPISKLQATIVPPGS